MRFELNDVEMHARNVRDLTEVQAKLSNSPQSKILKCMTSDTSAKKLILRVSFDANVVKNPAHIRFLEDKILDTVLTGVDGVGRVHLRTIKSEQTYDDSVGGYVTKDQYVLDTEGVNLHDLLVFPGMDGTRTFSNDIHEVNDVFGIEAARRAGMRAVALCTSHRADELTGPHVLASVNHYRDLMDSGFLETLHVATS